MDFQQIIDNFDWTLFLHESVLPWVKNIVFAILIFFIGRYVSGWIVALAGANQVGQVARQRERIHQRTSRHRRVNDAEQTAYRGDREVAGGQRQSPIHQGRHRRRPQQACDDESAGQNP